MPVDQRLYEAVQKDFYRYVVHLSEKFRILTYETASGRTPTTEYIEPTAMVGWVTNLQLSGNTLGFLRRESLVEQSFGTE